MHVRVDAKRRLYRVDCRAARGSASRVNELWGDRLDALKSHAEAGSAGRQSSRQSVGMKLVEHRVCDRGRSESRCTSCLPMPRCSWNGWRHSPTSTRRPGGAVTWTHVNGDSVIGTFVELVPARRVVFTYGWDREDVGIPPGIDHRARSTSIPTKKAPSCISSIAASRDRWPTPIVAGWANYLARLTACAEGRDPGPDPLAAERVPAARDVSAP